MANSKSNVTALRKADGASMHNRDSVAEIEQILATAHSLTETAAMAVGYLEHGGKLDTEAATALRQSIRGVGDLILGAMELADDLDLPADDAGRPAAADELQQSAH